MSAFFEEIVDTLDAEVFSGDSLVDKANRELLREHMIKWEKEIKEHESIYN